MSAPEPCCYHCGHAISTDATFEAQVRAVKRAIINEALDAAGGNRTHAAAALGLQRTYLMRLMREMKAYGTTAPTDPVTVRQIAGYARARQAS